MNRYIVKKEDMNKRIDKLISEVYKDISRVMIQKLIIEENLKVNDNKVKASYKVNVGDIIEFNIDEPEELDIMSYMKIMI